MPMTTSEHEELADVPTQPGVILILRLMNTSNSGVSHTSSL